MSAVAMTERPQPRAAPRDLVRRSVSGAIARGLAYLILTAGGILMVLPFAWLLSSSLKGPFEAYVFPPQWIPDPAHWENYPEVLTKLPFGLYVRNTLTITVGALIGQVITSAMCAYAFARLRFPGRDVIFGIILATMMLPSAVTLIPLYIFYKELRWLNTFLPLTVPFWFGGGAFNIFLLRQFFLTIPVELEEAATIDGATPLTTFARIMVPLSRPAVTVVAIFGFLHHWNDFLGPLIYLNSGDKRTIALGLAVMTAGLEWGRDQTHLVMAVSVIMITPIILIFFFAQRVFIQGIALTGIKG